MEEGQAGTQECSSVPAVPTVLAPQSSQISFPARQSAAAWPLRGIRDEEAWGEAPVGHLAGDMTTPMSMQLFHAASAPPRHGGATQPKPALANSHKPANQANSCLKVRGGSVALRPRAAHASTHDCRIAVIGLCMATVTRISISRASGLPIPGRQSAIPDKPAIVGVLV
jgi:hypothetical protein